MPIKQMTPPEAKDHLKQTEAVYLDVRTEQEFAAGHVPRAINIPVAFPGPGGQMQPNPEFLDIVQKVIGKDQPVVCGCKVGGRSQMAAILMEQVGYEDLVNLQGGFSGLQDPTTGEVIPGWEEEGYEVDATVDEGNSYEGQKKKAAG